MPDNADIRSQFYITVDGKDASDEMMSDLVELTVESTLHLPDVATIVLHDPLLRWLDDPAFLLGHTVQITAKSGSNRARIFDGDIVELEPEFGAASQQLSVRAFDRLHRLSRGRHVRSFVNMTDADIARKIAQESGLQADVHETSEVHPHVLQANETNLQFLQKRAAAVGYLVFADQKQLIFAPPKNDGSPIEVKWGEGLNEFRPRLTTLAQVNKVSARGWNPDKREAIVGETEKGQGAPDVGQEQTGGEIARQAFQIDAVDLKADTPLRTQSRARQWAQAIADRRAARFIEAEGACAGLPQLVAGSTLKVSNAGKKFSGEYFVTTATHRYSLHGGYRTEFSVSGQNPSTICSALLREHAALPNGGLVVGIVTDNNDDKGLGRVKVKYPWLSSEHSSDWARVVVLGGGPERGAQFLPEIDDEVLVGFELGDMNHPYILGGLWNGMDIPPKRSSEVVQSHKVQQRIIQSRSGHTIVFNDSDSAPGILIQDKNGNKLNLDSNSQTLSIEVSGSIKLKAEGEIALVGKSIKIDGGPGPVTVTGSVINLN